MTEIKPIIEAFGSLGALLLAGGFIYHLLSKMRNNGRVDGVNAGLYEQLQQQLSDAREQIADLNTKIGNVYDERNGLKEEMVVMRQRIQKLEDCEGLVEVLKQKLVEKDKIIADAIFENRRLMQEILQLKDRIHHLELRLAQDEARFDRGDHQ
jgi:chromosome segregation ATPase